MKTQQTIIFHKSKFQLNPLSTLGEGWCESGFTLIEIITSIAILAVITILGVTYTNNYKLTQYNTLRASDIDTLNNTMQSYYETNKKYPLPAGNRQYFDEYGVYTHANTGSYGVSGFITSQTFGKEFTLVTQKDPITKYYYAYARTLDNKPAFQFATSLDKKGTYYGYVKGIYSNNNLAGIVREYNGPNFVINNSSKYLPYNPHELKLTGNIISYSGTILVNNDISQVSKELEQSDIITVTTGSLATINLSDGSELRLGSTLRSSTLNLNTLSYKEDDNLLTKISLKLTLGEVWVKAPQLEDGSEFSLETDNAAASVRGTVFGMTTDGNGSGSISLIEGKLQIYPKNTNGDIDLDTLFPGVTTYTGSVRKVTTAGSIDTVVMEASNGISASVNYRSTSNIIYPSSVLTGTISQTTEDIIMTPQIKMKSSYIPRIVSFNKDSSNIGTIKFTNNEGNYYRIKAYNGTDNGLSQQIADDRTLLDNDLTLPITKTGFIDSVSQSVYLTGLYLLGKNELALQICDKNASISTSAENHDNLNCSSWVTLGFSLTSPIVITEDSTQKQEILKEKALGCPEGQQFSDITNHCEQSGLVAYAGYDIPGDIFMSVNGNKVLKTNTDNVITKYDFSPYYVVKDKTIIWSELKGSSGYGELYRVPVYNSTTSIFDTNSYTTSITSNTGGFVNYSSGYSFFELPYNGIFNNGGIFVDQKSSSEDIANRDYLKYDISPLQLNGPFTIEVSVRGAALKRTTGTGILFSIPNPNPNDSSKYLYFANVFGKIQLGHYPFTDNGIYAFKTGSINQLDNNLFYTVKIEYTRNYLNITPGDALFSYGPYLYNKNNFQISIKDINGSETVPFAYTYCGIYCTISFGVTDKMSYFTPQQIYIGSDPSGNNQWNDIIDWVKIYKN